ncbi:DUF2889 domain-containing protein [Rhizorhabdus wittichii]|uniref:DUF2889 domain-containing protein n=1 Tax=Rhizorhabdus wittichii TaxID=160791 RepID=UPI0009DA2B6D|nr:DUF2889 domain-containing protein [Rhizorhabdus wittichii]
MIDELAHFPTDPEYGSGIYRRGLRFVATEGSAVAQVDDDFHSYWLTLDHDGERVTAIDAGFNRAPTTMCPGSTAGLQALVGVALTASAHELLEQLPRTSNCTHLTDLALWSIAHHSRSSDWDVEIPDQTGDPVQIVVRRDGEPIHRWMMKDFHVVAPAELTGKPLLAGFRKWARDSFFDDALIAATMLQRGIFVARGRPYVVDRGAPMPLSRAVGMAGMCWAYSGDRLAKGFGTIGYVRDFSEAIHPEQSPPRVVARLEDRRS